MQNKSKKINKKPYLHHENSFSSYKKYDFDELAIFHGPLSKYVHISPQGVSTIDWKDPQALKELTKAILIIKFHLKYWDIPSNFLCPAIPSRLNYIEWISKLINPSKNSIKGLDIGTGASLIYPILGFKIFQWNFIGTEINPEAYKNAIEII